MTGGVRLLGFIDDQPITTMPKLCYRDGCGGRVQRKRKALGLTHGWFHLCLKCGVSYGPARPPRRRRRTR
jgi:hypothetical protein